jgi:hypothetical protein
MATTLGTNLTDATSISFNCAAKFTVVSSSEIHGPNRRNHR